MGDKRWAPKYFAGFAEGVTDKEAKPYQVRDARAFLEQAGVTP